MPVKDRFVQIVALLTGLLLIACSGSEYDSPSTDTTTGDTATGDTTDSVDANVTFTGYYQEDAGDNPEDPLPGEMYLNVPAGDGAFDGEFLFSYSGCDGGLDTGRLSGSRSASLLSGSWAGTVDLVSIGGTFDGTAKDETGGYAGTYLTSGGKTEINAGESCSYFVAGEGTWELFPVGGGSENVSISLDSDIVFEWSSGNGTEVSLISVYDKDCLSSQASIEACSVWNQLTSATTVTYGSGSATTVPLISGSGYVVTVIISQGNPETGYGAIKRYASGEFIAP